MDLELYYIRLVADAGVGANAALVGTVSAHMYRFSWRAETGDSVNENFPDTLSIRHSIIFLNSILQCVHRV